MLLRPSAPITTSKWKSERGWSDGWSSARHPEPEGKVQRLILKSLLTFGSLGKVQPRSGICQQTLSIDFCKCDRSKYLLGKLSDDFSTCPSVIGTLSIYSLTHRSRVAVCLLHAANIQITAYILTCIRLRHRWLQKSCEFHVDVDFHSQNKTDFQKHQLELADTWEMEINIRASREEKGWPTRGLIKRDSFNKSSKAWLFPFFHLC